MSMKTNRIWLVILLAMQLIACGGGSSVEDLGPELVEVHALDQRHVRAKLTASPDQRALAAENYRMTHADSSVLAIESVQDIGDQHVLLTTAPQQAGQYTLMLTGIYDGRHSRLSFASAQNPPRFVVDTLAISDTQVLVNFNQAVDSSVLDKTLYRIRAVEGGELEVAAVDPQADDHQLILRTAPQSDERYLLQIDQDVRGAQGALLDTVHNRVEFRGMSASDGRQPVLLSAEPTGRDEIVLRFSEPVDHSRLIDGLSFVPPLAVKAVQARNFGTELRLTTETIQKRVYEIHIESGAIRDARGNDLDLGSSESILRPVNKELLEAIDLDPPGLLDAFSTGTTTLSVQFDEPLEENSALDVANYLIYTAGPDGELEFLDIEQAVFGDESNELVVLTTGLQRPVSYQLSVGHIKDVNGNRMILRQLVDGLMRESVVAFVGWPGLIVDRTPPRLSNVAALSETSVLVEFSEAMDTDALDVRRYSIYRRLDSGLVEHLEISAAAFDPKRDDVVILATAVQIPAVYALEVVNVSDQAGNLIPGPGSELDPGLLLFAGRGSAPDLQAPSIVSVGAPSAARVRLQFSEPMQATALLAGNYTVYSLRSDGRPVPLVVREAGYLGSDPSVVQLVTAVQESRQYFVEVAALKDVAGNGLPGQRHGFIGRGEVPMLGEDERPRLLAAGAQSNTRILVQFSKPMGASAIDHRNYSVVVRDDSSPDANALVITGASFANSETRSTIVLETRSQSAVDYLLSVFNLQDRRGLPIAAPGQFGGVYLEPSRAQFSGIGADSDTVRDTDGDGLVDDLEQRGWTVLVTGMDGEQIASAVTSDPDRVDTDEDGVSDWQEFQRAMDPRSTDTDADDVADFDELNLWRSQPTRQDSDGDREMDGAEVHRFGTSPVDADTDGDGFDDHEELVLRSRDPRVADLPLPGVAVDSITSELDVRFTITDENGVQTSRSRSVGSTLTDSRESSLSTTDQQTTQAMHTAGATVGASYEWGLLGGASISAEASYEYSHSQGYMMQTEQTRAESSQRAYNESLTVDETLDVNQSVTRSVEGASVLAEVSLQNLGDTSFTMTNMELSLRLRDPAAPGRFKPVSSMLPQGDPELAVNLGPLGGFSQRGPFIFEAVDVFPSRVEELLKDPTSVIVQLANFDLSDEFGRQFSYAAQDVHDRTAGIVIDYGNGEVERYRVATHNGFDQFGEPRGISLRFALENILGLAGSNVIYDGGDGYADSYVAEGDDIQRVEYGYALPPGGAVVLAGPDGILQTQPCSVGDGTSAKSGGSSCDDHVGGEGYAVRPQWVSDAQGDALHVAPFVRVRDVATNLNDDPQSPATDESRNAWFALLGGGLNGQRVLKPLELTLRAGDDLTLAFVRDEDEDGLFARVEHLYGSNDRSMDTDEDGLDDYDEVMTGWTLRVAGQAPRKVFSSPVSVDTDGDRLSDDLERACGTDPRSRDTDGDGISDYDEIHGYPVRAISGSSIYQLQRYVGRAILPGPNGVLDSVVEQGDEKKTSGNREIIVAGPGQALNSTAMADDVLAAEHSVTAECDRDGFASDPRNPDTDYDGFMDGAETFFGKNPNNKSDGLFLADTDQDGVPDGLENHPDLGEGGGGYMIRVNGADIHVVSDHQSADTDFDGLPDLLELRLGSNPLLADTDADGLSDAQEFNPDRVCLSTGVAGECDFGQFKAAEFQQECNKHASCVVDFSQKGLGTNLNEIDSDGDGLNDFFEVTARSLTIEHHASGSQSWSDIRSNPLQPDSDGDGLSDSKENQIGSNPGINDSDGDGVEDGKEIATPDIAPNRGLPLSYRKRLATRAELEARAKYESWDIGDDCDGAGETGEFEWDLNLVLDTASFDLESGRKTEIDDGGSVPLKKSEANFYLPVGQSFSFSGTLTEDDGESGDDVAIFSETCAVSYNKLAGLSSQTCSIANNDIKPRDSEGDCLKEGTVKVWYQRVSTN